MIRNALQKILRRMLHMIICKRRHGEVAVVVVRLVSDIDAFLLPYLFSCSEEVLG